VNDNETFLKGFFKLVYYRKAGRALETLSVSLNEMKTKLVASAVEL
jgi:hypothetical protein